MKNDKKLIKEKLQGEHIELPEALKDEKIAALIENEAQTKAKKRNFAPYIFSAAAAVIVIVAGVLLGDGVFFKTSDINIPTETVAPETIQKTETDYSELSKILSANKEKLRNDIYFTDDGIDFDLSESVTGAPSASEGTAPSDSNSADHSSLNTRTEGVDEADIMKTDGKYIYALSSDGRGSGFYTYYMYGFAPGSVQSFSVFDKDLNKKGEIKLSAGSGEGNTVRERSYTGFFIYDDYVIFTGIQTTYSGSGLVYNEKEEYWELINPMNIKTKTISIISIYNISDLTDISAVKELYFSGSLLSSRITNGKLIAVSSYYPNYSVFNETDYTTFVPMAGEDGEYVPAENINILDEDEGNFTTVSLVSLDGEFKVESTSVLGQAWEIYCSNKNVYTYGVKSIYTERKGWRNMLGINKINISGDEPVYIATANFDGAELYNSFAIDEYNGFLRLALNEGTTDATPPHARIIVLDENMNEAGKSPAFAEDEYIRSARFMGNTAYVVTFKNTDPLFVFDLTDPKNPTLKGQISLPGFSAYLHPVTENYLVGIGYDGTEDGLNGGAKISLFDISNPEKPFEADNYTISSASLNSEYKDFVKKGENGYIVNFYDYDYYKGTAGALYFTVKNGKINIESRISTENTNADIIKTVYIENTIYLLIINYETGRYNVTAFDLFNGEKLKQAELG